MPGPDDLSYSTSSLWASFCALCSSNCKNSLFDKLEEYVGKLSLLIEAKKRHEKVKNSRYWLGGKDDAIMDSNNNVNLHNKKCEESRESFIKEWSCVVCSAREEGFLRKIETFVLEEERFIKRRNFYKKNIPSRKFLYDILLIMGRQSLSAISEHL